MIFYNFLSSNIFLKEELKNSDLWAVNAKVTLAQVVFEKDDELMKLKNLNRKLKTKMISLQGGLSSGSTSQSTK